MSRDHRRRALISDEYDPKGLAAVIGAQGRFHLHRITEGWIRTVLREGLRKDPGANVRLHICKRDALRIWAYADEWYNRPNRPAYGLWCDKYRHLRPKLIYASDGEKAIVASKAPKRPKQVFSVEKMSPAIKTYIDRKIREAVDEAVKKVLPPKPRKQITDGRDKVISSDRVGRERLLRRFVFSHFGDGPGFDREKKKVEALAMSAFLDACGGDDDGVINRILSNGNVIAYIEEIGLLNEYNRLLPDILRRIARELYPADDGQMELL